MKGNEVFDLAGWHREGRRKNNDNKKSNKINFGWQCLTFQCKPSKEKKVRSTTQKISSCSFLVIVPWCSSGRWRVVTRPGSHRWWLWSGLLCWVVRSAPPRQRVPGWLWPQSEALSPSLTPRSPHLGSRPLPWELPPATIYNVIIFRIISYSYNV